MPWVYILTNRSNTLYVGSTNDLKRRLNEHTGKYAKASFTEKYNIHKLVYCRQFDSLLEAREAERKLKGWTRKKKMELIKTINPEFADLKELSG